MPRPEGSSPAAGLADQLARQAEAVCRHYLPNGRREGSYWMAGDVADTPGRSLFVRLSGGGDGGRGAGKWSDAATGEHGDLLDLIAANRRCTSLRETLAEARGFLSLPPPAPSEPSLRDPAPQGSPEAARRLWAISRPIAGTPAETYLHGRGLLDLTHCRSLRFHPRCWYRPSRDDGPDTCEAWPALIAAVRNRDDTLTGVNRTWLDLSGSDKAPIATPRRAMGHLLGNGVWFGRPGPVIVAGEGIETILSLRQVLPMLPMIACLSANHLAALVFSAGLRRLYVAHDDDPAGRNAVTALSQRARETAIEAVPIAPTLGDFNDDLRRIGRDGLRDRVRDQLQVQDRAQYLAA